VFAGLALWEALAPWRRAPRGRWWGNLGLFAVDVAATRVLAPLGAVGVALIAEQRGWGLFNQLPLPGWAAGLASVLLLDLVIYGQHVAFHRIPLLWRLHRVHHADLALDVTTGLRFHPLEIGLSLLLKAGVVVGLGAPPLAVLVFEILLNATAMFTHADVRLPRPIEPLLRRLLVTPEMHRVHHSIVRRETDSNFGFNLSLWDRLFRTYRREAAAGEAAMTLGLPLFRDPGETRLDRLLLQPLRRAQPAAARAQATSESSSISPEVRASSRPRA
jgi:sterol desaturase/sphingolipid hydroxylase (fatty acid hydroxylase superfamily)